MNPQELRKETSVTDKFFGRSGADLIAAERQRQIDREGWTAEHDDQWEDGELRKAARVYLQWVGATYINRVDSEGRRAVPPGWPWDREWWKPSEDVRADLVKAGALIAAELDRLNRQNYGGGANG